MLSRRIGVQHLAIIEDSVQSALMAGLESWEARGLPDNPTAWLYKVASNKVIGELRQRINQDRVLEQNIEHSYLLTEPVSESLSSAMFQDDVLFMLFVCCDDAIPLESQIVFALKSLCGFSIPEIALRLFITQANAYKRFSRCRQYLKNKPQESWDLNHGEYSSRLPAINKVIYLLFTEGYLSLSHDASIRIELCDEAIRLANVLVSHKVGQTSETFALLALMHLHMARMNTRQDNSGGLLLLEDQDRSKWNPQLIQYGLNWLEKSSFGEVFTRYHAEAGIAAEHCLANTFQQTRWDRIVDNYLLLETISPSAIHRLNRSIAVAQWQGAEAGLAVLHGFEPPGWLLGAFIWSAVLADLHQRNGDTEKAQNYLNDALSSAPTTAVKVLLEKRFRVHSSESK